MEAFRGIFDGGLQFFVAQLKRGENAQTITTRAAT
jgi:hypothetical protein